MQQPSDNRAPRFPVSIKGVIRIGPRFVLLRNERDEWELPGGKLEYGEDPPVCLAREIQEELSLDVTVAELIDCWLYRIVEGVEVVIVTYGTVYGGTDQPKLSTEHKEVGLFTLQEIDTLKIPPGYVRSMKRWDEMQRSKTA